VLLVFFVATIFTATTKLPLVDFLLLPVVVVVVVRVEGVRGRLVRADKHGTAEGKNKETPSTAACHG
jgi:hypothetical protein